eukprot:10574_4
MSPLMSKKRNRKFKCGLLLLKPTSVESEHTRMLLFVCNTFFELSFTVYFGEIDTKKTPKCVYRERENEREKERKNREKTIFFHFFKKKLPSS